MNFLVGAKSSCLTSFRPKMSARVYIALFALLIAVVVTVSAQDENDAFGQVKLEFRNSERTLNIHTEGGH